MGKHPYRITLALCTALAAFSLAACGGSSSGVAAVSQASGQSQAPAATDLSGIAAVGRPLSGTIYLSDASFPTQSLSAVINPDGSYSFGASDLATLKAPFIMKAVDNSGSAWYSLAPGAGTANVNPLTTLALAMATGSADLQGLSDSFGAHNAATLNVLCSTFPQALFRVGAALQPLLAVYGASGKDPLAGFYALNRQGLDGFLDQVGITISQGQVIMTDKTNLATVFTAPLANLDAGRVTLSALSAPATYYLPGNAALTLALQGELPTGTLVRRASFTLQLPLGFTVDSGPSAVNTALPIGSAAFSNVYPAPALSATDNQLSVSLSSLDGFGTGNFLTIRCLVSSAALLATGAQDFSSSAANFYSDIYKNVRLKGISVAAVSLVFPSHEGKALCGSLCASCHNLSSSDTTTASLYGKSSQLTALAGARHHGIVLSAAQAGYLTEYLDALSSGQAVY
jgi:hypothetical protein